ncbi:MAG: alpha-L-fucosidase [Phycisphaerales bacterium]|nr:alpha-L-fucosidase [Phycisphaerales bacterium]
MILRHSGTALLTAALLSACAPRAVTSSSAAQQDDPAQPEAAPHQQDAPSDRLDWWRDARFGMFIHWGLYSIPAGERDGRTDHAEWIRTTAEIPLGEYEQFRHRFNPIDFDADSWCKLAHDAGMRYIVITTKHHDGFALFASAHTDFDVMSTPFQRDIMKELADAARRHGLAICWYHSIMDWHHPDYLPRRDWETARITKDANFERYVAFLHAQVRELLTNYGPIGVMWFDGEWESTWTHAHGQPLYDLCRQLQPAVIVNNRADKGRGHLSMTESGFAGDYGTPEQEIPPEGVPGVDWETCMTLNDHWGYNAADHNYKSSRQVIRSLVDVASKGGNFLLNVGPDAMGRIPTENADRLRAVGRWMSVNGESIYDTAAGPLEPLAWGRSTTKPTERGVTTLYLHVFDWPSSGVVSFDGLTNRVRRARLLAEPQRELAVDRDGAATRVLVPAQAPDADCSVIAVEIEGEPEVVRAPRFVNSIVQFISSRVVAIEPAPGAKDPSKAPAIRYTLDGAAPTAASPLYTGPFTIDHSCTVTAQSFVNDKPVSGPASLQFSQVTPMPASAPETTRRGLYCDWYEGEWDSLPDFESIRQRGRAIVNDVSLPAAPTPAERIARRYIGFIRVPADDVYEFELTSDDGSRLLIDDQVIVNNDGLHTAVPKRGTAALAAGLHPIVVEYFNKTGGTALSLTYGPAGGPLKPLSAGSLLRELVPAE